MHATAVAEVPLKTHPGTTIFDASNPGFHTNFDEKPFEFKHCFNEDHPMFQLPRIRQILDHPVLMHHAYYDHGPIVIGQRWKELPERKLSSKEVFDNIDVASGWMMLRLAGSRW